MAVLLDIADAVVTELNSRSWSSDSFTAVRRNIPRHNRSDMANLHVTVVPKSIKRETVVRNRYYENVECYIGLEKGLNGDSNGETDPLISLGESIADYFSKGRQLIGYAGATCVNSEFGDGDGTPWMSIKTDSEQLLYTGIALVEFQLLRTV